MTVSHLAFAMAATAYIPVAIQFDAEYRKQVPMLVPGLPRRVALTGTANRAHR
jgi:hypothetical protein